MRDLSAGMLAQVTAEKLKPFILLDLHFDSGDVFMWSGARALNFNGNEYQAAGTMLSVGAIQETADIKATGRAYQLNGASSSLVSLALTENYQGRIVREYFGAFDDAGNIITDPYQSFLGRMDVITPVTDGLESLLTLTAESILVDLESEDERLMTDTDQQMDFAGDRFFDLLIENADREIVWGRA